MNWVRAGIVVSLLLCVWVAWPKGDNSTPPRPLLIKSALKQADDPIVILGDSVVRQANLPRMLCKRNVVNAGIDGSTTASGLDNMLKKAIGDKKAAMIVVSLGVGDALAATGPDVYRANYAALIAALKPLTARIAMTTVTGVQPLIDSYNAALPAIADAHGARLISVPPLPADATDGAHLAPAGYAIWEKAVRDGIEATLCPTAS